MGTFGLYPCSILTKACHRYFMKALEKRPLKKRKHKKEVHNIFPLRKMKYFQLPWVPVGLAVLVNLALL